MVRYPQVSIDVDGTTVEGTITHLSPTDITVRIDGRFSGIESHLHLPYFGRPWGDFQVNGQITARAVDGAERTLADIYQDCLEVVSRRHAEIGEIVRVLGPEWRSRRAKQAADLRAWRQRRRELRRAVKEGVLSPKRHGRVARALKNDDPRGRDLLEELAKEVSNRLDPSLDDKSFGRFEDLLRRFFL